ncbi:MAG: SCO family protein [Candidatus Omnitrophica bacterium]|nr:SCO family protein [Candidatus Omnitrophota bacterium]
MSRRSYPAASVGLPLLIGVGIGGLALLRWAPARWQAALPIYGEVPAFTLVDQQGQPVSRDTLRGTVWVADFIFTRCAGQCPMMSAQMTQLAARLPYHSDVRLVSFTVDPAWDTPDVLARYAAQYRTSASAWSFLTGDEATIQRLCREGFLMALSEHGTDVEPIPPPAARRGAARSANSRAVADGDAAGGGTITHSTRLVLVDRQGQIRGSYDATDEAAMRQLHRDLRRVL